MEYSSFIHQYLTLVRVVSSKVLMTSYIISRTTSSKGCGLGGVEFEWSDKG